MLRTAECFWNYLGVAGALVGRSLFTLTWSSPLLLPSGLSPIWGSRDRHVMLKQYNNIFFCLLYKFWITLNWYKHTLFPQEWSYPLFCLLLPSFVQSLWTTLHKWLQLKVSCLLWFSSVKICPQQFSEQFSAQACRIVWPKKENVGVFWEL